MNVLLIAPDMRSIATIQGATGKAPNLGLLYIASALRENGHSVFYKNPAIEGKNYRKNLLSLVERERIDLIGISTLNLSIENDCRMIHEIRKRFPKVLIIAGGWFVAFRPGVVARFSDADIVVKGEGEVTFQQIADLAKQWGMHHPLTEENFETLKKIPGLVVSYYKTPTKSISLLQKLYQIFVASYYKTPTAKTCKSTGEPQFLTEEEINQLPPPAWDLVDLNEYWKDLTHKTLHVVTSRGCCFNCKICALWKRCHGRIRYYTIRKMVDMVKKLAEEFAPEGIFFVDDTFTVDKKRALVLCDSIIKCKNEGSIPKDLKFICMSRAGLVDEELLEIMKLAGFVRIDFGFESGSQKVLDEFGKGITVKQIRATCDMMKKHDIVFTAYLILTSPESRIDDLLDTLDLIIYIVSRGGTVACNFDYIACEGADLTAEYRKKDPGRIVYEELSLPYFEGGTEKEHLIGRGSRIPPNDKALRVVNSAAQRHYSKYASCAIHLLGFAFIESLFEAFKEEMPKFKQKPKKYGLTPEQIRGYERRLETTRLELRRVFKRFCFVA